MLSVVIATEDSSVALVSTLAALVPGSVAGVVLEVILADAGSHAETAVVAEVAGCRVLTSAQRRGARLKAAARAARGHWLLFLPPGAVPEAGWIDETRRFVEDTERTGRANDRAAAFRSAASHFDMGVLRGLVRLFEHGRRQPNPSLLIAKSHYDACGGHRDVDDAERELIRRLGRHRVVHLRTRTTVGSGDPG
jgi:hypothetical protein